MSRTKIAAAYKAAEQLSVLSKMDFSSEKTAEITEDDVAAYFPSAGAGIVSNVLGIPGASLVSPVMLGAMAPEGRGLSRIGHSMGGGVLGSIGGLLAGGALGGRLGAIGGAGLGALGGGLKGFSMSREADPMYMRAIRELGLGYEY
jgi:hypothetical protein